MKGTTMSDETRMEAGDDPADFTVDQVNDYLNRTEGAGSEAHTAVLAAERQGQARKGILGAYDAEGSDKPEDDSDGRLTTKGATFQEAAEDAEPDTKGYLGESPEAIRVGRRDKGLSQRNPAVMNQGGQVPDPSPFVDDSEAIASLKADQD
jgi:hypothetical protein